MGFKTDSYAFQAEILVKMIKSGFSYVEVPVEDKFDKHAATKAFSLANIAAVALFLFRLVYEAGRRK